MKTAMIFPGQGSQQLQMLSDFHAETIIQKTFSEASDYLGYDVWKLSQNGPVELLNTTSHTQPILLTAGIALFRLWQHRGGQQPNLMAGHSLGEYTALVASDSLNFKDACHLTALRGSLMQEAVPYGSGLMAAIIGLEDKVVEEICQQAQMGQVVSPANYNAIGQIVISGDAEAVTRACALAQTAGAKLTTVLSVSVPSHCDLMKSITEDFSEQLNKIAFRTPNTPIIHNVDLSLASAPESIRTLLVKQLYSPVRWVETILKMKSLGVMEMMECGPGRVLTGLSKRIDRTLVMHCLQDSAGFESALERSSE